MRPLHGITVVTLEHAVAAPFCSRQLADLGARVIKIERPHSGDFARAYDTRVRGLSSHFVWANRSKESLTLNLKCESATEILARLFERSDILVQNLAPGATQRLGVDFESLHAKYPRLIVCDISGYGADGPYRNKKAYDLLIQGESGLISVTGSPDTPCKVGASIADIAAGMYAFTNILAALLQRAMTGRGSRIDISLLECMVEWNGYPLYYAFEGAPPPSRAGSDHATIFPYGSFAVGKHERVLLGIQSEREWQIFCCSVLRRPHLAEDSRYASNSLRSEARAELRNLIEENFVELTAAEVITRLDAAGIANARLNQLSEVWNHPQLHARQRWVEIDTSVGPVAALLPPGKCSDWSPRMEAVPALGEHTDAILRELGYTSPAIAGLRNSKVV